MCKLGTAAATWLLLLRLLHLGSRRAHAANLLAIGPPRSAAAFACVAGVRVLRCTCRRAAPGRPHKHFNLHNLHFPTFLLPSPPAQVFPHVLSYYLAHLSPCGPGMTFICTLGLQPKFMNAARFRICKARCRLLLCLRLWLRLRL